MSKSINFVQERRKTLSLAEQQDVIFLNKVVRGFIGVFIVFLVILGGRFFLSYQLNQVLEDQKAARAGILASESVEREYSIFSHKINQLTALWDKRKNKQEAIAFFMRLFTTDTTISGISYSADTDALTFQLKATSIFVLEAALNTLTSTTVTTEYPSIYKENLSRGEDASYTMSVIVALQNTDELE